MSMIGNYLRITPESLAVLIPKSRLDLTTSSTPTASMPIRKAGISTSKSPGSPFISSSIMIPGESDPPLVHAVLVRHTHWRRGRRLSALPDVSIPSQLGVTPRALNEISEVQLLERFDAEVMNECEIYPHGWSGNEEERAYLSTYYLEIVGFFRQTAQVGDAMILYLN